jgi:glycerophosphoryl diester phosphodiesterase
MPFDLQDAAAKKLLLVAHRGIWGGNIPCNTIPAYETALRQGADMIEIDVDYTADGKLIVFHPGMERAFLGFGDSLHRYPWEFVKQLRYLNIDDTPTQFGIETLDDVLEEFKGKCYINVDKFWAKPREISAAIRAHGMTEQMLVKTGVDRKYLEIVSEFCADMPYMAIVKSEEEIVTARAAIRRYVGTEVLFTQDDSPLCSPAFIESHHRDGLLVWCNAIVYNHRRVLAGGHSDDAAVLGDPEGSWGWIADRGFDLMQTDRVLESALFLDKTGRRKRGHTC